MTTLTKTVTLAPGQSQQVSFQVVPTEAGLYQVSVNGLTGSFVATPPPVASLSGYVAEAGEAIVSAKVTIVEHLDLMKANVYRTFSDTKGFYSLENMAFGNRPIIVDISVESTGYIMIKQKDVPLAEGDNTLNFDMIWGGGSRDVPSFISYQLPDQIVSGEWFPVSMTIYLPYQDELFKANLQIQLPEIPQWNTMVRWGLLPATLYDGLTDKKDYIRFDRAGEYTLEAIGKAVRFGTWKWSRERGWWREETPLPLGTYDVNAFVERYHVEPINGTLKYGGISDAYYEWGPVKVGTVEII